MEKPNDLYADCLAAGIETDSHESDLYIKDCPKARELLKKHGVTGMPFVSQIDNKVWLDVPFMYTPFWEKKEEVRKRIKSV
jgi:hypothetical protein